MHYYSHRYTSPKSQLVITALLTSVEVVINVSWLMYEPPSVTHSFPNRESRLLICEGLNDYSYMVGLIYPFFLIGNDFLHTPNRLKSEMYMSVVNPDPEMRSSGKVHNVYQLPSPQSNLTSITGFSTDSGNDQCELQDYTCYFRESFPKSERATTVIPTHVFYVECKIICHII